MTPTTPRSRLNRSSRRDTTFREVIAFAYLTGWQFDEIRRLEMRHLDLNRGVATFPKSEYKTGDRTEKELIKILPPEALRLSSG